MMILTYMPIIVPMRDHSDRPMALLPAIIILIACIIASLVVAWILISDYKSYRIKKKLKKDMEEKENRRFRKWM